MSLQDAINTGISPALDWTNIRFKSLTIDQNFDVNGDVIVSGDLVVNGDISATNATFTGNTIINDLDAVNINTSTFSTTSTSNFNGDVNFLAGNQFDNQMDSTYGGVSNFNNNVNFNQTGYIDVPVFKGGLIIGDHAANPSYLFYGYERKFHTMATGAQNGCTINGATYVIHAERFGNIVHMTLVAGAGSSLTKNDTDNLFDFQFNNAAIYDLLGAVPGDFNCGTCSFDVEIASFPIITSVCIDVVAPNQVNIEFVSTIDIPDATVFHNSNSSLTFSVYSPLPAPTP